MPVRFSFFTYPFRSMQKLRSFVLLVIPLMLAACAFDSGGSSQPPATVDRSGNSLRPDSKMAGLCIFKEGVTVSAADSTQLNLDGKMVGLVAWNSYLYLNVTPGKHTLTSGTSQIYLDLEAGQNYFVRQTPNLDGGEIGSSTLSIVPQDAGREEIKQMDLSRRHG